MNFFFLFFPLLLGGGEVRGPKKIKIKSKIVATSLAIMSVRLPAHVSICSVHKTPKSRRGWFQYSMVLDGGSFQSDGLLIKIPGVYRPVNSLKKKKLFLWTQNL